MSVDFQEPGNEQKETINSGVKAAAAGGFTRSGSSANIRTFKR